MAVWHRLQRLRKYNSEQWARQKQSRIARQKHKRRRAQGTPTALLGGDPHRREKCPGKGGAKKAAKAYASDFYAAPMVPQGACRGPKYQEEPKDGKAGPVPCGGAALFTPPLWPTAPPPLGCAFQPLAPIRSAQARARGGGGVLHGLWHNSAAPPCPLQRTWHIV